MVHPNYTANLVNTGHPFKPQAMPVRVDIITDMASELVLHWGTNRPGSRQWMIPPEETWPEDTIVAGHAAADTSLLNCDDAECDVEISGSKVRCCVTILFDTGLSP